MKGMDLVTWLLEQIAKDEQSARAMGHAIENLQSRWSPARLLADCESKRRIITLYQNAARAQQRGSVSAYNQTQDEAAGDVLGAAVQALALPYAHLHGYREEWKQQ